MSRLPRLSGQPGRTGLTDELHPRVVGVSWKACGDEYKTSLLLLIVKLTATIPLKILNSRQAAWFKILVELKVTEMSIADFRDFLLEVIY
jgi:hypothetical protein